MDLAAILTGIAAVFTATFGVVLAVREVRRKERRDSLAAIHLLESELNDVREELVEYHRYVFEMRRHLADSGIMSPEPPKPP